MEGAIKTFDQQDTQLNDHHIAETADGSQTVNVTNRNVATSRLADLLGVGDLVARSEKVELQDAEGGGKRTGNLMQVAQGKALTDYYADTYGDEVMAQKNTTTVNPWDITGIDEETVRARTTPEYMESLTSLQVLDNLAGQVDRHGKNVFVQTDAEGRMGKVQGIDNDLSFGTLDATGDERGMMGNEGMSILDKEGNMALPHMNAQLADRILAVRENDLRLTMADVLESKAIDALCKRVSAVQKAIREDQAKNPHSGRYLKNTADWNEQVLDDMVKERLAYLKEELGTVTPYMEKHIEEFTGDASELNELGKSVFQLGRKSAEAGLKEQNRRRRKGMGLEN